MNIDKLKNNTDISESVKNLGENPKKDIQTLTDVFAQEVTIGKNTYRLKKIKGADLFNLVNKFSFSGAKVDISDDNEITEFSLKEVYNNFGENFDFAMQHLEVSQNGGDYMDLVIKGIYQVAEVETNIAVMYRLLFFIYQAVMLFMQISQQQLEDMN